MTRLPQKLPERLPQNASLALLQRDPEISLAAVAGRVGLTVDGVRYHIRKLKSAGAIRRVGSSRAGRWEVLK